ncbi:flagellar hook-basal body protein [bacterium]|nr:flagellar hook-basal body protein [bacterium]
MIRSLNTAERAMQLEQVRIDALANNLANVNTTGFKQILTRVAQPDDPNGGGGTNPGQQVQAQTGARQTPGTGNWAPVTRMDLTHALDNRRGPVTATGRDTDIAVMGDGFFELATPDGPVYTRDGSFTVNAQQQLTSADGKLVQGEGGPITLDGKDFAVGPDGTVTVDGRPAGRLKLVEFDDPTRLEHMGDGVVRAPDFLEPKPVPQDRVVVAQGHLEGSNVNPIDTLVALITAQRAFEVQSKVMKTEDDLLSKSVNTLPRVNA